MNDFIEIPASKKSLAMRKPVYGIGINDAKYIVIQLAHGKRVTCPFYRRWKDMLKRCYSDKFHEKRPTYIGCTISKEWLTFSNFKGWMIDQEWRGMALDKDLLETGNKVYSPEFCVFIPHSLNNLLCDSAAIRGEWPIGVSFHKKAGKFRAYCGCGEKSKHLGLFPSPEAASNAYQTFKSSYILEVAQEYSHDSRLYSALIRLAS